jgi:hypothetical protein
MSFVVPLALTYFTPLSHKWRDFLKNVIKRKIFVLISSTILSIAVLILRRIQRDIVTNVKTPSRKLPAILVGF